MLVGLGAITLPISVAGQTKVPRLDLAPSQMWSIKSNQPTTAKVVRRNCPMSIKMAIEQSLISLKYEPVGNSAYKALWGEKSIEHFLYFSIYGTPKQFVSADFGLRNSQAEQFAVDTVKEIGGRLYRTLRHDSERDCKMRFPFGKVAGWTPRWSISTARMSEQDLVDRIQIDVTRFLFPLVKPIVTAQSFLELLLLDRDPFHWFRVNAAIRAAQIGFLARRFGSGSTEIRTMLSPFKTEIATALPSSVTPKEFIKEVVRRSATVYI